MNLSKMLMAMLLACASAFTWAGTYQAHDSSVSYFVSGGTANKSVSITEDDISTGKTVISDGATTTSYLDSSLFVDLTWTFVVKFTPSFPGETPNGFLKGKIRRKYTAQALMGVMEVGDPWDDVVTGIQSEGTSVIDGPSGCFESVIWPPNQTDTSGGWVYDNMAPEQDVTWVQSGSYWYGTVTFVEDYQLDLNGTRSSEDAGYISSISPSASTTHYTRLEFIGTNRVAPAL